MVKLYWRGELVHPDKGLTSLTFGDSAEPKHFELLFCWRSARDLRTDTKMTRTKAGDHRWNRLVVEALGHADWLCGVGKGCERDGIAQRLELAHGSGLAFAGLRWL